MANSRYTSTETDKNENGDRVYNTTLYPDLNQNLEDDIFITTETGERLDILANRYYNDSSLWWVIAQANNIGKGSLYVEAGTRLRIPTNVSDVFNKLRQINDR